MLPCDDEEIMNRAHAAYYRGHKKLGGVLLGPGNSSGVEEIGEKAYAVLRNGDGILAVYRIKPDGYLKRLKRWPKDLEYVIERLPSEP